MISYNKDEGLKLMPKFRHTLITKWIKAVADCYGYTIGEVGYEFCTDDRILEVNKEYLQHDYYTDIITFDYTEGNVLNGDIVISVDTVKSNAKLFKVSPERELLRVIIHGILHLTGQNDKSPTDEAVMHQKEDKALTLYDALANA